MPSRPLKRRLLAKLVDTPVVDCHSHTMNPEDYYKSKFDLFSLGSYFNRDISGVLNRPVDNLFGNEKTDAARWRVLKGVLDKARNTTYARHYLIMYREFFGLKDAELNDRNWRSVNENIRRKTKEKRWYAEITKKRCKLVTAMRNVTPFAERWDPEYFTPILRMERVLRLHVEGPGDGLRKFEEGTGCTIGSIRALRRAIAKLMESYRRQGAVGVKFGHAYWRTLYHSEVSDADAGKVLQKIIAKRRLSDAEIKTLQDWGFREVVRASGEMDLVVQIHTGVQTNWGHIPDSDPLHLLNVIRANPKVRFDLFHAGYPYSRELGMLGKHYPNVWLNMCWMYVITIAGSRQILKEWIDLVPGHRLLGFGSDVGTPEFIHAHLVLARECIADVLADKVENDFLSEEAAMRLIERMMLDNACELYGIRKPRR